MDNGCWKGETAGGCGNHPLTYPKNPKYEFTIDRTSDILIDLKGPKQFLIGFDIVCVQLTDSDSAGAFSKKSSGAYRLIKKKIFYFQLDSNDLYTYEIILDRDS